MRIGYGNLKFSDGNAQFDGNGSYIKMNSLDNWIFDNDISLHTSFTISFQFQIPLNTNGNQTLIHRQSLRLTDIFMVSFIFGSLYVQNVSIIIQGQSSTIPITVQLISGIFIKIKYGNTNIDTTWHQVVIQISSPPFSSSGYIHVMIDGTETNPKWQQASIIIHITLHN